LASKLPRTELVRSTPDLSGALLTGLVQPVLDLSGIQQFCFQKLITSSLLVTSCPCYVVDLSFMPPIPGWILITRKGPSIGKMWLGPPSGVTSARRLRVMDLLIHVTPPSHSSDDDEEERDFLSGMHLLSGPPT
jgi:hypothetical protein